MTSQWIFIYLPFSRPRRWLRYFGEFSHAVAQKCRMAQECTFCWPVTILFYMLFCIVTFNIWLHYNKLLTYLLNIWNSWYRQFTTKPSNSVQLDSWRQCRVPWRLGRCICSISIVNAFYTGVATASKAHCWRVKWVNERMKVSMSPVDRYCTTVFCYHVFFTR